MSRLEFRAQVEAPRPASAWVMVFVGGVTLWITRQLAPWAIAGQALALVLSLALRREPRGWQRNPLVLNAAMLLLTGASFSIAVRGGSIVVALAHFAALTQGLQLLDARPRRSEFLLVALALFQVTLAANLTDSILFIPLVAAFVVSTTWTLLVHTLRTEAIEAGTPGAVGKAITPGLMRTTVVASAATCLLALALFVLLPRMRASVVQSVGSGAAFATAGFSDRVALGDLGRIRQDATVVLRVETLQGNPPRPEWAYWRGLAFDRFDGRSWSITPSTRQPVPGIAEVGVTLGWSPHPPNLVQRIVREPVTAGVIFAQGEPRSLHGPVRRLQRDANGGLYAPAQSLERLRYTLASELRPRGDERLGRDRAREPEGARGRHLQLPPFAGPVAELAARVTADASNDAERARALEAFLRRTGRYTDVAPEGDASGRLSPVEAFLFGDKAGHCEYFATAMVVLARSIGLPARLVNGFAGGRANPIGGFLELTRSDAHAWVEVHFAEAGWVRYDPTPPDLRLRAIQPPSLPERLRQLGSAIELWWFQRVVDFDRSDQLRAMRAAWLAWRDWRAESPAYAPARPGKPAAELDLASRDRWLLLACALALAGLAWRARRRPEPVGELPRSYARALRLLARRGLRRAPPTTARAFAARVAGELPGEVARAFDALTESYLRERFGGRRDPRSGAALVRLERAMRGQTRSLRGDGGRATR